MSPANFKFQRQQEKGRINPGTRDVETWWCVERERERDKPTCNRRPMFSYKFILIYSDGVFFLKGGGDEVPPQSLARQYLATFFNYFRIRGRFLRRFVFSWFLTLHKGRARSDLKRLKNRLLAAIQSIAREPGVLFTKLVDVCLKNYR